MTCPVDEIVCEFAPRVFDNLTLISRMDRSPFFGVAKGL